MILGILVAILLQLQTLYIDFVGGGEFRPPVCYPKDIDAEGSSGDHTSESVDIEAVT